MNAVSMFEGFIYFGGKIYFINCFGLKILFVLNFKIINNSNNYNPRG